MGWRWDRSGFCWAQQPWRRNSERWNRTNTGGFIRSHPQPLGWEYHVDVTEDCKRDFGWSCVQDCKLTRCIEVTMQVLIAIVAAAASAGMRWRGRSNDGSHQHTCYQLQLCSVAFSNISGGICHQKENQDTQLHFIKQRFTCRGAPQSHPTVSLIMIPRDFCLAATQIRNTFTPKDWGNLDLFVMIEPRIQQHRWPSTKQLLALHTSVVSVRVVSVSMLGLLVRNMDNHLDAARICRRKGSLTYLWTRTLYIHTDGCWCLWSSSPLS